MQNGWAVNSTLDSTLESIDAGTEEIERFAARSGFEESDRYFISLAAREILANAVKHGNRFDPAKKITLRLSNSPDGIAIEISDQGDGFDPSKVPDPCAPENLSKRSGRGLLMATSFMDSIVFENASTGGTRVRMSKKLTPPT